MSSSSCPSVLRLAVAYCAAASLVLVSASAPLAQNAPPRAGDIDRALDEAAYVQWLEDRSMLRQADTLAKSYSGNSTQWREPYAIPQPRAASARASVWFTAYPAATISLPEASVLRTLADAGLWRAFEKIGIQAVHTGPIKRAGAVRGRILTPTVDGGFDRIGLDIDPAFGTTAEYRDMASAARDHGAIVIGDVIPGHTGKGADFRLAERGHRDFPGLYHMVAVEAMDWGLLPAVPPGRDSVNLTPEAVDALAAKGYIVGQLQRTFFHKPGVKDTDWSATGAVRGVDGVERRWVYLHYFKEGQPTLNWLDPSFAAQRLVIGDVLHEIGILGNGMLRLDANGFLGIERNEPSGRAWSQGHPLSVTANQLLGGMVRKLGAFTFQELNLTLEYLREMSRGGTDLSYDFITRPAYHHALATGDAEFLRLMLALMREHGIDPAGLVHALQNHDELTMELVHFAAHPTETFPYHGTRLSGADLRTRIHREMFSVLTGERAPFNLQAGDGIACTTTSLIAAALGIRDITKLTRTDSRNITRAHTLIAAFNALQPGVFALSGWDLVGALTLPAESVQDRLTDGDVRWINRGAYDLMGASHRATRSAAGLPRAVALYGSLPEQLQQPDSFAAQLARMLQVRKDLQLHFATQIDVPEVQARGLLVMVHELPEARGIEITALNFGRERVDEVVVIHRATPGADVIDAMNVSAAPVGAVAADGGVRIRLRELESQALLIKP